MPTVLEEHRAIDTHVVIIRAVRRNGGRLALKRINQECEKIQVQPYKIDSRLKSSYQEVAERDFITLGDVVSPFVKTKPISFARKENARWINELVYSVSDFEQAREENFRVQLKSSSSLK